MSLLLDRLQDWQKLSLTLLGKAVSDPPSMYKWDKRGCNASQQGVVLPLGSTHRMRNFILPEVIGEPFNLKPLLPSNSQSWPTSPSSMGWDERKRRKETAATPSTDDVLFEMATLEISLFGDLAQELAKESTVLLGIDGVLPRS